MYRIKDRELSEYYHELKKIQLTQVWKCFCKLEDEKFHSTMF
jgi:hypothetical protein